MDGAPDALWWLAGYGEVEGYRLGELDSVGGGGGDLVLVDAGWGVAEAGISSAAAAGEGQGGCAEEGCPEEEGLAVLAGSGLPEEEQGCGQEAEEVSVVFV